MLPLLLWCAGAAAVVLDVPYIRQEKNGCGAAALAMIMEYWHKRPVDPKPIHDLLYSPKARGTYASEMERYLRAQGYRTFAITGEWDDLKQHLEKGRPLIVALKPSSGDLHYVVLTGLDSQAGMILKHDPAGRKLQKQNRGEFEREWKAAGHWTLLAVPLDGASR